MQKLLISFVICRGVFIETYPINCIILYLLNINLGLCPGLDNRRYRAKMVCFDNFYCKILYWTWACY